MPIRDPVTVLPTHEVTNQPPELADIDLFALDLPLREGLVREGAGWAAPRVAALGRLAGSEGVIELGRLANAFPPELRVFDRHGWRIDEVRFHPAYHELMALAMAHGIHSVAWTAEGKGGHVAHVALGYLLTQAEAGVLCPMAMTYAAVPVLRRLPALAEEWLPRALSTRYDPRMVPAAEKSAVTIGMAMTEKQGGSDLRATTTRATPLAAGGAGEPYRLFGHKWFCSAPMSDGFLTLAQAPNGLSCFFVPRWRPDGTRNPFLLQRLKDKLGNRSNASAEIEYADTWGVLVGDEGRGVRTILKMVHHTRLDCAMAAAGLMRQALVQAIHHTRHRRAFQRRLVDQALMRAVLADLAVEAEAGLTLVLRVARVFDEADPAARAFARLAVALAKYWLNRRAPGFVHEAMECLGGSGYIEEGPLPRLYREAPLNGIWEGSGNVICLDIQRTLQREPAAFEALLAELAASHGANPALDAAIASARDSTAGEMADERSARRLAERLALTLQGALLARSAPKAVADAFCGTRLAAGSGRAYGASPAATDEPSILERAFPE